MRTSVSMQASAWVSGVPPGNPSCRSGHAVFPRPRRRIRRPAPGVILLQQRADIAPEIDPEADPCRLRARIRAIRREHEGAECWPVFRHLLHHDLRQVVRKLAAFVGARERLARPEFLYFGRAPECKMPPMHLVGRTER